jgi:hypothetical protein
MIGRGELGAHAGDQMDLNAGFYWDTEGRLVRITYPAAAKSKLDSRTGNRCPARWSPTPTTVWGVPPR